MIKNHPTFEQQILRYVKGVSYFVISISVFVIVGWQFNIDYFTSVIPGMTPMNPFTAIGLALISSWQLVQIKIFKKGLTIFATIISLFCSAMLLSIGAFKLFDVFRITQYNFDLLFYTGKIKSGTISQLTAISFIFMGITPLIMLGKWNHNMVLFTLLPVFVLTTISVYGYMIGIDNLFYSENFKPMALHSAASFVLLCSSVLFLFPHNSIATIIIKRDYGGLIARRLLPYVITIPVLIAFLRYKGEEKGLYSTGLGVAIFMIASILMFLLVIVTQSLKLSESEKIKSEAEETALQRSEELALLNVELEQKNAELSQFTFAASHDMQEPLRKIQLFISMIQKNTGISRSELNSYLDKTSNLAARIRLILDDVVYYSSSNEVNTVKKQVDLNIVIQYVITELHENIKETEITIKAKKLSTVYGIEAQLRQLFYSLIMNALKFRSEKGNSRVTIACRDLNETEGETYHLPIRTQKYIMIELKDNGIGFNDDYSEQIFGLFKRLNPEIPGTGVGLAVSRKIVTNHQGRIWAKGEPGKGACFYIILPASQNETK
jgi:signal transduction histidine kinase